MKHVHRTCSEESTVITRRVGARTPIIRFWAWRRRRYQSLASLAQGVAIRMGSPLPERLIVLAGWHKGSGAEKYLCLACRATPRVS
jgi:hypothetical protein